MHIEMLKVFCDLADLRSFSRTAEKHLLSQSAISQQLAQLELAYKSQLINRKKRPIELTKAGLVSEAEKPLKVFYDDQIVGNFFVDLFIENEIVVELKSVKKLAKEHEVQLVNYLNALKKDIGLLINFGPTSVEVKRKFRNSESFDERNKEVFI